MQAIVVEEFGTADVLKLAEVDQPERNAGQVLVKIEAATVNARKFKFAEEIDPSFLALAEEVRYQTFFSNAADPKTIQLVCFALLLQQGSKAAEHHAKAARKMGVSWDELWLMCKIASTVCGGLGPLNLGGSALSQLKEHEHDE